MAAWVGAPRSRTQKCPVLKNSACCSDACGINDSGFQAFRLQAFRKLHTKWCPSSLMNSACLSDAYRLNGSAVRDVRRSKALAGACDKLEQDESPKVPVLTEGSSRMRLQVSPRPMEQHSSSQIITAGSVVGSTPPRPCSDIYHVRHFTQGKTCVLSA